MNHSASSRLKSASLELADTFGRARESWRDSKAEEFENQSVIPIMRSVEAACLAIDEITAIVSQMQRECGPPRDETA
jgi:division protein CdvB (Snf7/Vps24/ESCRT-III family)